MKLLSLNKINLLIPWFGGLVLIGISAIATINYLNNKDNLSSELIASQTIPVKSQNLTVQIQANGTVQALRTNNLSPDEPGRIAKLEIKEGDRVSQGQVIAQMDSDRIQAQVNQYQAALQKAEANLAQVKAGNRPEAIAAAEARVKTAQANVAVAQEKLRRTQSEKQRNQLLVDQGAISINKFEEFTSQEAEAQANLEAQLAQLAEQQQNLAETKQGSRIEEIAQAQAELAEAKAELASVQIQYHKTTVRAPFAGIITRRYAEKGDYVDSTTAASDTEGATSTSIAELASGLEIEAKIPEANIAQIKLGQTVNIQVDAYSNETFKGKVSLIAPRAVKDNNVTSFRVKVALITGLEKLQSGMNTRLTFVGEPIIDAITIPLATVVTQADGKTGVYLADAENKAQFQPIKLGAASGDRVEILAGLTKGDHIFTSPPPNVTIEGVDTVNFE
ncbi:efflux RND transporter periplasmic adaptor subunit [Pleurocapsa sp. CCALA 161]|uniref:efflux RND transporter periplasmic adaptor subunit n=1 Tax=Pleurocapsa sp. CCALA 161 TaxID=2107688 RepID=UPI000D062CEA|nr:efflux RND transporter periplasmic adaptor subunit [Pleurocapsa sp. CCALA 161]PSB09026.1 efflux RND transporter periplasmic adaptor subunit [Pleurocapsa sp. CCALA 161]